MRTLNVKMCLVMTVVFIICLIQPLIASKSAEPNDMAILMDTGDAIANIAQRASPAVVSVRIEKTVKSSDVSDSLGNSQLDPFEQFFNKFFGGNGDNFFNFQIPQTPQTPKHLEGLGSGFIMEKNGYIMTNNHVVSDADKLTVTLLSGKEYLAKVIGTDPPTDLAVIKVDAEDLPTLEFGDSEKLRVGDWVIAIGNPFGLTSTVTVGVASAKGRSGIGVEDYEDFIQTDAAINMGNSGGPLLDARGKVIGINTAILSPSGGSLGIGFAIPSNVANTIYIQLKQNGHVTRGYLGVSIQQLTPSLAQYFHLPSGKGILIAEVSKDSPAEKAGLKQGDVITRINDKPADNLSEFRNYVAMLPPDSKAQLVIMRNGKEEKLTVMIGKLPVEAKQKAVPPETGKDIGLTVQNLTDDIAAQFGYQGQKGVVITSVTPGSPADEAGLQAGELITQVNQEPVTSVDDFQAKVKKSLQQGSVLFLIKSKKYTGYVVIKIK